jgi:hypothetical protein
MNNEFLHMKSKGLPLNSIVALGKSFPVIESHEICDTPAIHGTAIDFIIPYGQASGACMPYWQSEIEIEVEIERNGAEGPGSLDLDSGLDLLRLRRG